MADSVAIQIQRLTYAAQTPGNDMTAVADINGHRVVCSVQAQTRNGRRVESTYWRMDGERIKFADLMAALNGSAQ
jgi:hypothetical protein